MSVDRLNVIFHLPIKNLEMKNKLIITITITIIITITIKTSQLTSLEKSRIFLFSQAKRISVLLSEDSWGRGVKLENLWNKKPKSSVLFSNTRGFKTKQSPGQSLLQHLIPSLKGGGGVGKTKKWGMQLCNIRNVIINFEPEWIHSPFQYDKTSYAIQTSKINMTKTSSHSDLSTVEEKGVVCLDNLFNVPLRESHSTVSVQIQKIRWVFGLN